MSDVEILRRAEEILKTQGWCQHTPSTHDGKVCAAKAIAKAGKGSGKSFQDAWNAFEETINTQALAQERLRIAEWNDVHGRTLVDVLGAIRVTIRRLENSGC